MQTTTSPYPAQPPCTFVHSWHFIWISWKYKCCFECLRNFSWPCRRRHIIYREAACTSLSFDSCQSRRYSTAKCYPQPAFYLVLLGFFFFSSSFWGMEMAVQSTAEFYPHFAFYLGFLGFLKFIYFIFCERDWPDYVDTHISFWFVLISWKWFLSD